MVISSNVSLFAGQLVQGGAVLQVPRDAPGQRQQRGRAAGARGKNHLHKKYLV